MMSVAPSAKRQRLIPQPMDSFSTRDPTNNVSNIQLINPSYSYLCHLPPPLFAMICEYLDLEYKCVSLPMLNSSVKRLFNPVLCCKGSLTIDLRYHNSVVEQSTRLSSRLTYTPFATSVKWRFNHVQSLHSDVQSVVRQAMLAMLDNPALQSFSIIEEKDFSKILEECDVDSGNVPLVLSKLSQMPSTYISKLRVLELRMYFHPDSEVCPSNSYDWSGLKSCKSMHSLSVCIDFRPDHLFESFLDNLPDSLTEVKIYHSENSLAILNARLMSPVFLPLLRLLPRWGFCDESEYDDDLFAGLSTVIPATGRPRFIEKLNLLVQRSGFHLNWCDQVHTLHVKCDACLMDEFLAVTNDAMPLLRDFSFGSLNPLTNSHPDITPAIIFASKRPIDTIKLAGWGLWDDVRYQQISHTAITCLANMVTLVSLELSYLCLFHSDDTLGIGGSSLMEGACWTRLTKLTLKNFRWSLEDATCLIQATPNLMELTVQWLGNGISTFFSWVPLIPVVAQCCPNIVSFLVGTPYFSRYRSDDENTLHVLQAAYASWPLANMGFQRLQRLHIDGSDASCLAIRWGLFKHSFESCELFVFDRDGFSARFRTLTDVPAVDGRNLFFDRLYCCLEETEQENSTNHSFSYDCC